MENGLDAAGDDADFEVFWCGFTNFSPAGARTDGEFHFRDGNRERDGFVVADNFVGCFDTGNRRDNVNIVFW